jgi:hypothetical protein
MCKLLASAAISLGLVSSSVVHADSYEDYMSRLHEQQEWSDLQRSMDTFDAEERASSAQLQRYRLQRQLDDLQFDMDELLAERRAR